MTSHIIHIGKDKTLHEFPAVYCKLQHMINLSLDDGNAHLRRRAQGRYRRREVKQRCRSGSGYGGHSGAIRERR